MESGEGQRAGRAGWTGSWLGGARSAGADLGYPGERLGLPETGGGAVAGYGRRLTALAVDLLLASVIAAFLARVLGWDQMTRSWVSTGVFGLQAWLLTGLLGITIGKRLCGLRVVRLDGRPVGPFWSLARALLLLAVVPALLWDRDHRGLHDRAAHVVVVQT
ncbi:MAG TPA: RDD family protein [Actinomadura sp.]|jgi:uncharacterized RDD family membrane protein YckC|nr:RDD family protein [Actinomadura sp.]